MKCSTASYSAVHLPVIVLILTASNALQPLPILQVPCSLAVQPLRAGTEHNFGSLTDTQTLDYLQVMFRSDKNTSGFQLF